MKILITGAQGQVGQEFVALNRSDLICLSRSECDITDLPNLKSAIKRYQPNFIINTAAYTAVDKAETEIDLAYQINRDGVANLAMLCKQHNIPLIHISTDYVFDGNKKSAYLETDLPNPQSVYGASKLSGEQALIQLHEQYIILRVSWVFGQFGKNFVKTIIRLAKEREELKIVADQLGCPTSAHSIAEVALTIVEHINQGKTSWGVYHYCNLKPTNWFEFAQKIVAEAKKYKSLAVQNMIPITTADYPTPAKRPANSVLNCQKFQAEFGIISANWERELAKVVRTLGSN